MSNQKSPLQHSAMRAAAAIDARTVQVCPLDLAFLLADLDTMRTAAPKPKAKKATPNELPDWLPLDAWGAFLDMRKKIKKPPTEYAQQLLLKKLGGFYAADMDPAAILNQSIMNGWQDLYAPNDQQGVAVGYDSRNGRPVRAGRQQQQADANAEALRRLDGIPAFDSNVIDMGGADGIR